MTVSLTKDDVLDDDGAGEEATDSPAPEGLLRGLRPYLPTWYIAGVLCSGSLALSRRGLDWATAGGWSAARGRLAALVLGVYVAGYEQTHGQTWILPAAGGAWILGALVLHSPAKTASAASAADVDEDQELDADDEVSQEWEDGRESAPLPRRVDLDVVARTARRLAGAPGSANSRAVQLDDLVAHLDGVAKDDLVVALKAAVVPVRDVKYRLAGGRQQVRQGVRLEDLPARAGEGPATPAPAPHAVPAPAGPGTPAQAPAAGPAERSPTPAPAPLQGAR